MSDAESTVDCAHGTTAATFVCKHLAGRGRDKGFVRERKDDDPWPDAWCDKCEAMLVKGGGVWTDALTEKADIQVVCGYCWDESFVRNTAKRVTETTVRRFVRKCCRELEEKMAAWESEFGIGEYPLFKWSDEDAVLRFGSESSWPVTCDIVVAGTWGKASSTWLWSWANADFPEGVRVPLVPVKRFGEQRGYEPLMRSVVEADAEDAWHQAAVAAHVIGAQAAYRVPYDRGEILLLVLRTEKK